MQLDTVRPMVRQGEGGQLQGPRQWTKRVESDARQLRYSPQFALPLQAKRGAIPHHVSGSSETAQRGPVTPLGENDLLCGSLGGSPCARNSRSPGAASVNIPGRQVLALRRLFLPWNTEQDAGH